MYTIGDFLIQVKNAYMANKKELLYPKSKVVVAISRVLEKEGYVGKIASKEGSDKNRSELKNELLYKNRMPAVSDIKIVSKPSVHHYVDHAHLKRVLGKFGTAIISTSKGVMSGRDAQKAGLGGEIICQVS